MRRDSLRKLRRFIQLPRACPADHGGGATVGHRVEILPWCRRTRSRCRPTRRGPVHRRVACASRRHGCEVSPPLRRGALRCGPTGVWHAADPQDHYGTATPAPLLLASSGIQAALGPTVCGLLCRFTQAPRQSPHTPLVLMWTSLPAGRCHRLSRERRAGAGRWCRTRAGTK
jgi:hypothetical protein